MRRVGVVGLLVVGALGAHVACGNEDEGAGPVADAGSLPGDAAAVVVDAADPRCATEATFLGTHPHASQQPTPLGKTLSDTRGWKGLLYFGYGDFEANTGPIHLTSFDPKTKDWQEHPVAWVVNGVAKAMPAFGTHAVERFFPIGDSLWATAAQPVFGAPFDRYNAPDIAIATGGHDWRQVDFAPDAIHVVSAIERAPGDVYVTGSGLMTADAGATGAAVGRPGGHVWRSVDGGAFKTIFPDFPASTGGAEYFDLSGGWISGAALNGVAYMSQTGYIYKHDGTKWDSWEEFGQFLAPVSFAGRLLFADMGQFFAFDGTNRTNLDFRFFESPGRYQSRKEPLALFQVTEGRLLAVRHDGRVMMTKDLATWSCIGRAPAEATSIGSLDGVVYFGSVTSGVYGFPAPSW